MVSDTTPIQAEALRAISGINHAFFTRQGGVSGGIYESRNIGLGSDDTKDAVLENRTRCATELGTSASLLATPYQVHSPDVITVKDVWAPGEGPKADGVVTDKKGIMLGIATADCGPVLFADEKAQIIGAAHAGWRGATGGVLENTVSSMEKLGAKRQNITAVLGPTIAQTSYEVGPEFIDNLKALSPDNVRYFKPGERSNHAMFDLPNYIIDRLHQAGIKLAENLDLDTYEDEDRFYSFRRTTHRGEPDYGRLLSAIVLKG